MKQRSLFVIRLNRLSISALSNDLLGPRFISDRELNKQLDNWLSRAELLHGPARAIIAP